MKETEEPDAESEDEDDYDPYEDEEQSDYQWCLHCERAYKRGEFRFENGLKMCPFEGCGGDAVFDGWDWENFRVQIPGYPRIPTIGKRYPAYPTQEERVAIAAEHSEENPPNSILPETTPEDGEAQSATVLPSGSSEPSMELSEAGLAILQFLVSEIRNGRFKPDQPYTFCGYKETHERLELSKKGPQWGNSLRYQGLADLAIWVHRNGLPAITGLIVGESEPRHPGSGYFEVNEVADESFDWWRDQIRSAIAYDWSPWVKDTEPVTAMDFAMESRSYLEGANTQVSREVKTRCDALRKRVRELFRDADGYLRCKVCGWHKPDHGMISGEIVELHHLDPISKAPDDGRTIKIEDAAQMLVPVCPNCHRMIHSRTGGEQFDPTALRQILETTNRLFG